MRQAMIKSEIAAAIDIVRDGQAAAKYIDAVGADEKAACPDLILLDMNLPKMSGHEVLKYLRASSRCKHSRVLIVSSSDAPQDRAVVENPAVVGYFKKPSTYAEFMKLGPIVRDLLDRDQTESRRQGVR